MGQGAGSVVDRAEGQLVVEQCAVLAVVAQGHGRAPLLSQRRSDLQPCRLVAVLTLQKAAVAPQELGGRVAAEALESWVSVNDRVIVLLGVGHDDADRTRREGLAQELGIRGWVRLGVMHASSAWLKLNFKASQ